MKIELFKYNPNQRRDERGRWAKDSTDLSGNSNDHNKEVSSALKKMKDVYGHNKVLKYIGSNPPDKSFYSVGRAFGAHGVTSDDGTMIFVPNDNKTKEEVTKLIRKGFIANLGVGPFQSVAAHELAHSYYVQLPEEKKLEILAVIYDLSSKEMRSISGYAGLENSSNQFGSEDELIAEALSLHAYKPGTNSAADKIAEAFKSASSNLHKGQLERVPGKQNWIDRSGGLPDMIERIAVHLHEGGMDISHAIAVAVNAVKRGCATGDLNFPGAQHMNAGSRAEYCNAVKEWEAKKAKARVSKGIRGRKLSDEEYMRNSGIILDLSKFNPYHAPPGSPTGGEFTTEDQASDKGKKKPTDDYKKGEFNPKSGAKDDGKGIEKYSDEAKKYQAQLNHLGYKIAIDGLVGPETRNALKKYQEDNGLEVSGELDDATKKKMVEHPLWRKDAAEEKKKQRTEEKKTEHASGRRHRRTSSGSGSKIKVSYKDEKVSAEASGEVKKTFSIDVPIKKIDEDRRLAFGWASVAVGKDGAAPYDSDGDVIADVEDMEEAGYNFVVNCREAGEMHTRTGIGELVESFVVTPEKLEKMGLPEGSLPLGWWVGFRVNDESVWEKVKKGDYKMFSVHGRGRRTPLED